MQIRISNDYSASIDFIGGGMIRWYDGGTGRYIDFDRQQSAIMLRTMRGVEELCDHRSSDPRTSRQTTTRRATSSTLVSRHCD